MGSSSAVDVMMEWNSHSYKRDLFFTIFLNYNYIIVSKIHPTKP